MNLYEYRTRKHTNPSSTNGANRTPYGLHRLTHTPAQMRVAQMLARDLKLAK
jgi:hypothetical protein